MIFVVLFKVLAVTELLKSVGRSLDEAAHSSVELFESLKERRIAGGEHTNRQKSGVSSVANCNGGDWNTARHLHDR